jgi:phospholipase C
VKGLYTKITKSGPVGPLLTDNSNEFNPERLSPSEAFTSDQNHSYTPEQDADNGGAQDKFVQNTESSSSVGCGVEYCAPGVSMDYFDGNTVTALWNYAQNYAMSDNNFDTVFGPSSPGAIDVTSGDTGNGYAADANDTSTPGVETADAGSVYNPTNGTDGTIYGDIDPFYDQCSDSNHTTTGPEGVQTGANIGDLLNGKNVSWGWFQGGFAPTSTNSGGAVCGSSGSFTVTNSNGSETETAENYVPHHNPFQFNATTANPAHLAPTSLSQIGYTDQANHQYDLSYFSDALNGTGGAQLPAVSYIKPPAINNAHPGNSDPLEEQEFDVNTINSIEKSKYWPSTAIIITYDDSDGWYDSVTPPVINGSDTSLDTSVCTSVKLTVSSQEARCGYGDRLPFIVISPYTRENYVSNNLTNTASVVKFIEDNWLGGERIPGSFDASSGSIDAPGGLLDFHVKPHVEPVILNPTTGAVVSGDSWYGNKGELTSAKKK